MLVTEVPEITQVAATILSICCIAMELAASWKAENCARREAMVYPWNMPAMTSTATPRATATSIRVNAEAALLSRDGRNIRIGLSDSQNLLLATSFQLPFVKHFAGHVNPADAFSGHKSTD
jgi:hypothetical protein